MQWLHQRWCDLAVAEKAQTTESNPSAFRKGLSKLRFKFDSKAKRYVLRKTHHFRSRVPIRRLLGELDREKANVSLCLSVVLVEILRRQPQAPQQTSDLVARSVLDTTLDPRNLGVLGLFQLCSREAAASNANSP